MEGMEGWRWEGRAEEVVDGVPVPREKEEGKNSKEEEWECE